jgi:hypothetical protein
MTLTEKAQRLWDWTVGELKEHGFEKVSVFQVRGQGLRTIDVVFSPGLNAWIARSPQGDSVTFEVRES